MKRVLFSVATATLLGAGLVVPTGSTVAAGSAGDSGRHAGPASAASARVSEGTDIRWDPSTLTRQESADLEARQQRILERSGLATQQRANGSVTIRVDFHNVTDRRGHGFVSRARIHRQIRVLNEAYSGHSGPRAANTPFRFRINSISRTKNRDWYTADYFTKKGRQELREMQRTLHVGNYKHLNIYTVGPKVQLLGYANYPGTVRLKQDGLVIWAGTMPGGNATFGPGERYNQGDTATHEIGHWLNVRHTFEGSCGKRNDFVTDTPRQKADDNVFEEDVTLDTCGHPNGPRDPVRNFMNYTDDPFMNQFTRGQRERMDTAWYIRQALSD